MYRNYKSVEKVTSFEVKNNYLQYVKENSLFINDKIIDTNTDCIGVFIDEIYFVYSNYTDFKSRIYNIEKNEIFKIVDYNIQDLKSNFGYLAYKYDEKFNSNLLILNSDFNIQYNTNLLNTTISLVKSNIGIQKFNNTQIHAYTLPTAQPLWQFDLGVLGTYQDSSGKTKGYEVRQFVGVSGEELLVLLSDFRFVAIHIQTGQKTKDIHIPELITCTDGDYLSNFSGVHIDVENKRLIWLSGTSLFHIDISTFQLTQIKNHWHVPQSEKWRFMSSTLHKGLLYFTGDKGMEYVVATRIGVMNAETGEILWQQQLKKTGGLPNAPQVSNDKLYVLTVKKELYIFQKENPSI